NGAITYTANAGFTGTDQFYYTIKDSNGGTSASTSVSVRVNAPTAADDWTDTDGTTPVKVSVLGNDTNGGATRRQVASSVSIVAAPTHGSAVVHSDGTVTYTANAGFTGTDSFRYTVKDDHGATSNIATASVRINTPTAGDDWTDTDGTTPVKVSVLAND